MATPSRLRLASCLALVLASAQAPGLAHAQGFPPVAPTPTEVRPAVDRAITQLMAAPKVQKALEAVKADHQRSVDEMRTLTEIEAPPFKEQKKAEAYLARMKALGLADAKID